MLSDLSDVPSDLLPVLVLDGLTPESATRTHYFWSTTRPWGLGDKKVEDLYRSMIDVGFNEDKTIVEPQQRLISLRGRTCAARAAVPAREALFRLYPVQISSSSIRRHDARPDRLVPRLPSSGSVEAVVEPVSV
jgi:hypothetical protein